VQRQRGTTSRPYACSYCEFSISRIVDSHSTARERALSFNETYLSAIKMQLIDVLFVLFDKTRPRDSICSRMSTPTPSERQVAFGDSLFLFFKNFFSFSGRTGRSGHWW
tara:strand:+ start:1198 stop:1524 length:327 start_codon:yes stop_codon:yes gene_type:complete